jgi:hypothetical protein
MNTIIDFLKKVFGLKPKVVTKVVATKNKTVSKNIKKSDLNEISLKINKSNTKELDTQNEKPKKKRYYKKKPTNKENPTEIKKETTKKVEKTPINTEDKKNGTTKKRYRSKKPKSPSTVQPESRPN